MTDVYKNKKKSDLEYMTSERKIDKEERTKKRFTERRKNKIKKDWHSIQDKSERFKY